MKTGTSETMFQRVFDVIMDRRKNFPENSYVTSLMDKGIDSILKKIGEESTEVILAAKNANRKETIHEITDLWFHLLILMGYQEISIEDISQELRKRFGQSGFEEKAKR